MNSPFGLAFPVQAHTVNDVWWKGVSDGAFAVCIVVILVFAVHTAFRISRSLKIVNPSDPTLFGTGWRANSDMQPGIASDMVPLKYNVHALLQLHPNDRVIQYAKRIALPVSLLTFNVSGNLNIGICIRTAAVYGCSNVIIVGKSHYDRRSAVGAQNYVGIERVADILDPVEFCRERKILPVLVEQGGIPLEDIDFRPMFSDSNMLELPFKGVVFIVGSESDGIPTHILRGLADAPRVTISQYGVIRSLNVSTAAAIVLYEYFRQWRKYTMSRI